jgi:nitrate/TMAO reductase-like tetraheme cytochrome c subunit
MKHTLALLLALALAVPVRADHYTVPKNPLLAEECGSCHMVYPPQMLGARSWQALMADLKRHFGTDASLDVQKTALISRYLTANAATGKRGETLDTAGKPLLRITQTSRFLHKHDEVAASTWKRSAVKSPANCSACHTRATAGDFEEENVRIPR